ncbi:MAG: trypsin-like serine protease [Bdellovibrio sp.]|nr:trypsin-like serine protease [Bdellovibrio sp.]
MQGMQKKFYSLGLQEVVLGMVLLAGQGVFAADKTICGPSDDRDLSDNVKIGRVLERGAPAGCTITLIGRSCVLSAGHCIGTFHVAEFNTPPSSNGRIAHPAEKDIYEVDRASIVSKNNGQGDDFAVFRLKANNITGQYAGEVQGHYNVSFDPPRVGAMVRITGYGADRSQGDRNYAQQSHVGPITQISDTILYHQVDTMGGNSGSTVILEEEQEIIGIHTHGGCSSYSGSNASTLISAHSALKQAIQNCLKLDN